MENVKYRDILKRGFVFILVYGLIILTYHVFGYELIGDDLNVAENIKSSLIEELACIDRSYCSWSSRVLINPLIWIIYHFDIKVWTFFNVALVIGCYIFVDYLSGRRAIQNSSYFFFLLLMLLIPFNISVEVGWVTTSVTYIWPLFFALVSCISIRKYYDDENINTSTSILICLTLIFASNKEELSIVLSVIFGFMCVVSLIDRKFKMLFVVQLLISCGSVMFHLFSSGNADRVVNSSKFVNLSIFDKLVIGIVSTLNHLFYGFDLFFTCFCIILFLLSLFLCSGVIKKIIACIPSVICLISMAVGIAISNGAFDSKILNQYVNPEVVLIDGSTVYLYGDILITIFVSVVGAICVVISVYNLINDYNKKILFVVSICAGFAGRVVIGFSGNGYGTFLRTYIFFYYILTIVLWYMFSRIENSKYIQVLKYVVLCMAVVNNFMVILEIGIL